MNAFPQRPDVPTPSDSTLHGRLLRTASSRPNATACTADGERLVHSEWDRQSRQLAHWLRATWGVGESTVIGMSMPRGPEALVAMLAIMRAGGCWMAIEADQPPEKIDAALRLAGCQLFLTGAGAPESTDSIQATWIRPFVDDEWLDDPAGSDFADRFDPLQTAFLIHDLDQSAAVGVSHADASRYMTSRMAFEHLDSGTVHPALAALSLDSSVGDLFRSLTADDEHACDAAIGPSRSEEELAEVAGALQALAPVKDVVVVSVRAANGGTELVAFVIPRAGASEHHIGSLVPSILPAHKVPSRIHLVDSFSLDRHGLVDRSLLESIARDLASPTTSRAHLGARFDVVAAQRADAVAVVFGDRRTTYAELARLAAAMAGHVSRHYGVVPGDTVGLLMHKSVETIVAILALMRLGAAYLPMDPRITPRQAAQVLHRAKARVCLTREMHFSVFEEFSGKVCAIDVESEWRHADPADGAPQDARALAYLIATSGSTGMPKLVPIEHRSICNYLDWRITANGFDERSVVMQAAPFYFDSSISETFSTLLAGGTLVLATDELLEIRRLSELINGHGVTAVCCVPRLFSSVLLKIEGGESIKLVTLAGERVTRSMVERHAQKFPAARLINEYGPTECSVGATYAVLSPGDDGAPSIGYAMPGINVFLLDQQLSEVTQSNTGQLHLSGIGLMRGYVDDPEQNARCFARHPITGQRLYATGDIARRRQDGALEYVGRIDRQVKIRGNRIELGEVELAIASHPGIDRAVCAARSRSDDEAPELVSWYTCLEGLTEDDLRMHVSGCLSSWKVPTLFCRVQEFETTANGKIAMQSLPDPFAAISERLQQAPSAGLNAGQARLARVWAQVLGDIAFKADSDFFSIGGDSLKAAVLIHLIAAEFRVRLTLRSVVESPCLGEMATMIEALPAQKDAEPVVDACLHLLRPPKGPRPPLVWVHPVTGNVDCYAALTQAIGGDRAIYALRAPSLTAIDDEDWTMSALARRYAAEVQRELGATTAWIAGWSFGGVLAREMVAELRSLGVEVLGVLMIDSWLPDVTLAFSRADSEADFERYLAAEFASFATGSAQLASSLASGSSEDSEARQFVRNLREMFIRNQRALLTHRVESGVARVHLVEAAPSGETPGAAASWRRLLGERAVESVRLEGNHFSLMHPDSAPHLAEVLEGFMSNSNSNLDLDLDRGGAVPSAVPGAP